MKIALLLAVLAVPALAAEPSAAKLIKDIEGVYKHHAQERIAVPGKPDEKFDTDDMVEVVRHDDSHIYLHAALFSDNGRHCNIAGIAAYEKGVFVYRDPNPGLADKQVCVLTVSVKGDALHLSDRAAPKGPSTCSELCGSRANLAEYVIDNSKKSKITYLPKLKASREYLKATKAYAEMQR